MNRSSRVLLFSVIFLAAALAACSNPADGTSEAVVQDPAGTDAADASGPPMTGEVFALTDATKIGFVGSKVTGTHEGGFEVFDGTITLVDEDPALSRVEMTIDATSLWADNEKLTGHLKSPDFFDVEAYPEVRFVSTGIASTPEGFAITGDLDLHGVQKSITFPASIIVGEGGITAEAEFFINRFDFGIEYAGRADDLIRDEVVIKFQLEAAPVG